MTKRPGVEPIRQPTLFDLQKSSGRADQPNTERPFSLPSIFLGTSSFTAAGWEGSFYPKGMRSKDFLRHYASQFQTVEIDSTFYGTPAASTVASWSEKTPADFIFAAKVPQIITHEKVLLDCEPEFDEFVERMHLLGDKLGPMLLQFPKFDKWVLKSPDEFRSRLRSFFTRAADLNAGRFAVEVRNRDWLDARLTDLLREHNVALALTDTSFMPRPWEMKSALDLVTTDFVYVRWLGNRKEIETMTMSWDKTVVDRTEDLRHWVKLCRQIVAERKVKHLFLFGNNHYQGHGPDTVKTFWRLWKET